MAENLESSLSNSNLPSNLRSSESREDRMWDDDDFSQAEKNIQEWRESDPESALVEARLMARKYVECNDYEAAWQTVLLIDFLFASDADLREAYGRKLSAAEVTEAVMANFRHETAQICGVKARTA